MKKTIAIFPASINNDNPYQSLIELCLKKAGFKVIKIPSRKFFPFLQLLNKNIDAVHMNWPHDFYIGKNIISGSIKRIMFLLSLFILKKMKIVYSADNLISHNKNTNVEFEKKWINMIIKRADGIICSSENAKNIFCKFFSYQETEKIKVIPHPSYQSLYKHTISKSHARKKLNFNDSRPILVAIGFIKSYKGYEQILSTISGLGNLKGTFIIAGRCQNKNLLDNLKRKIKLNQSGIKIILINRFLDNDEVQIYLNAADGTIFNYTDTPMNPGSLILAMGFGLNIIGPFKGAIPEIVPPDALFGFHPGDEEGIKKQLECFYTSNFLDASGLKCKEKIHNDHSISVIAKHYKNLYLDILK